MTRQPTAARYSPDLGPLMSAFTKHNPSIHYATIEPLSIYSRTHIQVQLRCLIATIRLPLCCPSLFLSSHYWRHRRHRQTSLRFLTTWFSLRDLFPLIILIAGLSAGSCAGSCACAGSSMDSGVVEFVGLYFYPVLHSLPL